MLSSMLSSPISLLNNLAASCTLPKQRFGIPTWYKYLEGQTDPVTKRCQLILDFDVDKVPAFLGIGIAAIEIMLVIAGMLAVGYILYGAFRYLVSQGNPDSTKVAKDAILNALIGLIIVIIASSVVRFAAGALLTT